jgi:hypothetical protein
MRPLKSVSHELPARLVALAAVVLWLAVAGGAGWLWLTLADLRADYLKPLWTATRLVQVQARVESVERAGGQIQVRYRYRFGDQTHVSERLTFDPQHGRSYSHRLDDLYSVYHLALRQRMPVTAWVDPQEPGFAVLDKSVQWLPAGATATALALLALLISATLRRALHAAMRLCFRDGSADPVPSGQEERFPWSVYRPAALLVLTANVAAWTFIPGSAATLLTTLAGAVALAFPLLHLNRWWARWRGPRNAKADDDHHWKVRPLAASTGVRLMGREWWGLAWICGYTALAMFAWVGYVLVNRSYHADVLSLTLAALGGLGATALAMACSRTALRIQFTRGWLRIDRGRGFRVERLGRIRVRDVVRIECLHDPLGDVASNASGRWRVFARLASSGTAEPLTPLLSAPQARAVEATLDDALQRALRAPVAAMAEDDAPGREAAPFAVLLIAGLALLALIGHWQWQRHVDGVRRVLPDGSVLIRKSERDALQRAIYARNVEAVEAALAAGTSPDRPDDEGRRPLHVAALLRTPEVAAALVRAGADVNARRTRVPYANSETPLMWAAGQPQMVETLLGAEADPRLRDDTGASAMHYAARNNSPAVLTLLHARGIPIDDSAAPQGATPLMWAFWWWAPEAIDWLVERGAALDGRDLRGLDLAHYARTSKEPDLALARLQQLRGRAAQRQGR